MNYLACSLTFMNARLLNPHLQPSLRIGTALLLLAGGSSTRVSGDHPVVCHGSYEPCPGISPTNGNDQDRVLFNIDVRRANDVDAPF